LTKQFPYHSSTDSETVCSIIIGWWWYIWLEIQVSF